MADKRKLEAEMERCIKRIHEGVEIFDEIWEKGQEVGNANQKEKFEADLKKEVKKLQRFRDQIKGWQNSNEIKDKTQLHEYRLLIEEKMELFKVIERENRIKAYSNKGLGAEQKLDPREKEKEETIGWLQDCLDRLNQQNDVFESEIERLWAAAGKKKLDKEKQDKLDQLKKHVERHKYHILKLELLMRLLNNNSIESFEVRKIKDDLEHYIDNNQEADFEENEFLYDDLELGEIELLAQQLNLGGGLADENENFDSNTDRSVSPSTSPLPWRDNDDPRMKTRHNSVGEETTKSSRVLNSAIRSTPGAPLKFTSQASTENLSTFPITVTSPLPLGIPYNLIAAGSKPISHTKATIISRLPSQAPVSTVLDIHDLKPSKIEITAEVAKVTSDTTVTTAVIVESTISSLIALARTPTLSAQQIQQSVASSAKLSSIPILQYQPSVQQVSVPRALPMTQRSPTPPTPVAPINAEIAQSSQHQAFQIPAAQSTLLPAQRVQRLASVGVTNGTVKPLDEGTSVSSLKSLAQQAAATSTLDVSSLTFNSSATSQQTASLQQTRQEPINVLASKEGQAFMRSLGQVNSRGSQEAKISPAQGIKPLGKVSLDHEHAQHLSMLETAVRHLPLPADSERLRTYLPRSPCQIPPYYPLVAPPLADTLEYFNRLNSETLFFIFYYMEGTKAQYLAAKALKRQSWRFHAKYMMWFQRHEEPRTLTDELEQKWAYRDREFEIMIKNCANESIDKMPFYSRV